MKLKLPLPVRRVILVTVFCGIFWLSHQPSLRLIPPLFPGQDKIYHAGEFFFLGMALYINMDLVRGRHRWLIMCLVGILWAALDEIHQSFIPGRYCTNGDFMADCAGLLIALLLLGARLKKKNSNELQLTKAGHSPPLK